MLGAVSGSKGRLWQDLHLELALHLRDDEAGVQAVGVCQNEQLWEFQAQGSL